MSLSGLDKEPQIKQVQTLTLILSCETLTIVDNLGLTKSKREKVESIVEAMQRYIEGHIKESVECRNFRRHVQQPGEVFDDFLVSLRELAKTCNFCSDKCTQKSICDKIIEGLVDGNTVEDLLQQKDLTLEAAITKCQAKEVAKRQHVEMARDGSESISAT